MALDYNDRYERKVTLPGEEWDEPSKPKWKVLLKALLVFLVLAIIGVLAYVYYILSSISADPLNMSPLSGAAEGRTNILVMGVGDVGHAGANLADTNMLVSIEHRTNRIAMISLPRDLRVPIPGYGMKKINQAHALGGPDLAVQTVEKTLKIPVHYYMKTDFSGLEEAVDAVGGVDVVVKERLYDPNYPCRNNPGKSCGFELDQGSHHLNGAMALQYVRCRKGTCGDDFGRAMRQQEVLQQVQARASDPNFVKTPYRLQRLSVTFKDNVKTNLSVNNMISLGLKTRKIPENGIQNIVLSNKPGGYLTNSSFGSDLVPIGGNFRTIQELVRDVFERPQNVPDPNRT